MHSKEASFAVRRFAREGDKYEYAPVKYKMAVVHVYYTDHIITNRPV